MGLLSATAWAADPAPGPPPPPGGGGGLSQSAPLSPWVVALAAGLLLFGAAWLWQLARDRGAAGPPRALERLPGAGVMGPGTAPLSEGLQVWEVAPELAPAAIGPLLARLAQRHRVVVAGPERAPLPAVAGGPVYRAPGARPERLGEWAARLAEAPGLPVTVLVLGRGRDASDLRARHRGLPPGIGGVVLLEPGARTALPTARLTREGGAWRLETDAASVALVVRDGAFARSDPPAAR